MKKTKFITMLVTIALAFVLLSFVACDSQQTPVIFGDTNEPPIDFGAKYFPESDSRYRNYYVFNDDHTGYVGKSSYRGEDPVVAEFMWEEASDGAVYLFANEAQSGETETVIKMPIYFSEDFFTYTDYEDSYYGSYYGKDRLVNYRFVKEDSDLDRYLSETEFSYRPIDTTPETYAETGASYR